MAAQSAAVRSPHPPRRPFSLGRELSGIRHHWADLTYPASAARHPARSADQAPLPPAPVAFPFSAPAALPPRQPSAGYRRPAPARSTRNLCISISPCQISGKAADRKKTLPSRRRKSEARSQHLDASHLRATATSDFADSPGPSENTLLALLKTRCRGMLSALSTVFPQPRPLLLQSCQLTHLMLPR